MKVQKYLYAIHDATNNEIIWNARGCAYHKLEGVKSKIKRLKKENPDNDYRLLCWQYVGSCRVKLED